MSDHTMQGSDAGSHRRSTALVVAAAVLALPVLGCQRGEVEVEAVIPAGSVLVGALDRTVSASGTNAGDPVLLELPGPTPIGDAVLPAGTIIRGAVIASAAAENGHPPELDIEFTHLEVNGEAYDIYAEPFRLMGVVDTVSPPAPDAAIASGVVPIHGDDLILGPGTRLQVRLIESVAVKMEPHSAERVSVY